MRMSAIQSLLSLSMNKLHPVVTESEGNWQLAPKLWEYMSNIKRVSFIWSNVCKLNIKGASKWNILFLNYTTAGLYGHVYCTCLLHGNTEQNIAPIYFRFIFHNKNGKFNTSLKKIWQCCISPVSTVVPFSWQAYTSVFPQHITDGFTETKFNFPNIHVFEAACHYINTICHKWNAKCSMSLHITVVSNLSCCSVVQYH